MTYAGDMSNAFPAQDQWQALASCGFQQWFAGTWVEGDDPEEIARLLRVDPDSAERCDLGSAMRWYEPMAFKEMVWIGEHAPGWTHVISISGPPLTTRDLAAAGRRFMQVIWYADGIGVHDLVYGDGRAVGALSPLDIRNVPQGSMFDGYNGGLPSHWGIVDFSTTGPARPVGTLKLWLDNWFCLVGRITGRFIDRDWLNATRTLYRIPLGTIIR
ncbi:hypothetical protein [Sphaerimonospora mesophila]|uniref:hypothetical protein n=1 Tax=Sphaerimonospora mesophila TaxID=37483 RepID=UPI0006E2B8CE